MIIRILADLFSYCLFESGNIMIPGDSMNELFADIFQNIVVNVSRTEGLILLNETSEKQCAYAEPVVNEVKRFEVPTSLLPDGRKSNVLSVTGTDVVIFFDAKYDVLFTFWHVFIQLFEPICC